MTAYEGYLSGKLEDQHYDEAALERSFEELPQV
jgi:hypothetical protein